MPKLFNPLSDYLKARFNCKVFKVTLNTGLTCPNKDGTKGYGGCAYCDSTALIPSEFAEHDIRAQLTKGMERVRKRHGAEKFIAYFQINTNTYAPVEYLEKIYRQTLHPDIAALAVSTRPDCVSDDVLNLLSEIKKERGLWLELGLQSANDATLKLINRGHSVEDFKDAALRASQRGIDVCAHVIIGLPDESREDALSSMRLLSGLGVWGVKFHQLQVIKGTRLEEMYNNGEVKPLTLEEYSEVVVECLEHLPGDTVIHRLCGDTPARSLAAPLWGVNKFMVTEKITGLMRLKGAFQGAKYGPLKESV
ncbi:MAG: TIGR01212 family radical SAM protein [Deltaproteobacteria bacterium]|nr:TIGR01212 family radical SAM protein [Deltaproteobacteria bacterium]